MYHRDAHTSYVTARLEDILKLHLALRFLSTSCLAAQYLNLYISIHEFLIDISQWYMKVYIFAHVPIVRIFAMVAMAHHAASFRYCSGPAAGHDEAGAVAYLCCSGEDVGPRWLDCCRSSKYMILTVRNCESLSISMFQLLERYELSVSSMYIVYWVCDYAALRLGMQGAKRKI